MLLHRRDLLKREPKGINHEYALCDIDAIRLVELESDDEQDEENQEADDIQT